ncbi:c-type cytochrome [Paracoccus benzoatiresistens]|uniref:Cytochrome c n=1 Tax=Paracoccus benzoatiresistens TaxID=2997341 RepID=A0ABT4J7X1_9RHOB|nr:cytochrome c [Paracoccus sp. EF6]MCZ0963193.1 cytochrome c [Paracoccus sp. EF6]
MPGEKQRFMLARSISVPGIKMRLPLILAVIIAGGGAFAQDRDIGADLYAGSCAGCHGAKADGKGPVSEVFRIPVPALTDLAARNGGRFPMLEVIQIIDGRTEKRGHDGVMPIFGTLFSHEHAGGASDQDVVLEVRGKILSIALYLESIQQ